jgi:hypothetical protein
MKQRGRKSRASLSVLPLRPHLVASSPPDNPPPPPAHLEEPEAEIWRAIVAEFKGPRVAYQVLADALKAHQRARECGEIIEREGYSETGRDGQNKPHHLLAAERAATASYQRQLRALGIKF